MTQALRLPGGGRIDRDRSLHFTFGGRPYQGYAGDTLASALLANGVRVTARSFKYHRPRGLMAAGCEEPNTLVQLESGARTEPNLKATQVELYDGLCARAVNCWPNARHDLQAAFQWLMPLMPAGFYYKTFMAPHWHWYEGIIRHAAGMGHGPKAPDPDVYDKRNLSCEVLVVGAGPAGLAAALAAARSGMRVVLVDDQPEVGGSLLYENRSVDGIPAETWRRRCATELAQMDNVTVLMRTTAAGCYDHHHLVAVEQLTDHLGPGRGQGPRQRLWKFRANEVILATGAIERPLVFPDNDRPGVMLAGAARHYLNRFAVAPGRCAVVATNNDSAYEAALDLHAAGVEIAAIADVREAPARALVESVRGLGVEVLAGFAPVAVTGARGVKGVDFGRVEAGGHAVADVRRRIAADCLLVSGGWNPTVHLFSQAGGTLRFDPALQAFVPEQSALPLRCVGAAAGVFDPDLTVAPLGETGVPALKSRPRKAWVDFQSDVTSDDLRLAVRENFRSAEHAKRYTTAGMATDQGKTSNVNAIGILAGTLHKTPGEVGTTKFRPPFNPVSFGAIAGRCCGSFYDVLRRLPAHERHLALGGAIEDYGGWLRPTCYPHDGESEAAAVRREVLAVRNGVGLFDASPLGKILVAGPDAAEFLNRIYVNNVKTLKPGNCRYGMMLTEDGIAMDDGILARHDEQLFQVGTTSGKAGRIAEWLEEWLQCEWTDLDVLVEPVTTQWATLTVAGPQARCVLDRLGTNVNLDPVAFPHMAVRDGEYDGMPVRIMRVSFTGELSYEVGVSWQYGRALWDALLDAGRDFGIVPYGVEAVMTMRIEKGYLHVGTDTDGMTLPQDIGFGAIIDKKRDDFIGRRSTMTPDAKRPDRRQFVGLAPRDGCTPLPVGGHVVGADFAALPYRTQGWVTSSVMSPTLGRPVALGLVAAGRARIGEEVRVFDAGRTIPAKIVEPAAYDPQGERLRA